MGHVDTWIGDLSNLPVDSSNLALKFLASFLPALDGSDHALRNKHLHPGATAATNGTAPQPFTNIEPMFDIRAERTSQFYHTVDRVWVTSDDDSPNITILMNSKSTTVFKGAEPNGIAIAEFSVIKLSPVDESVEGWKGRGKLGLWAESIETWMDPSPVKEAAAIFAKNS